MIKLKASSKGDMVAGKLINPLFTSLREQVVTENVMFESKGDIFNTSLTLLCEFCFERDDYLKRTLSLVKRIEGQISTDPGLAFIKEAALGYYLSSRLKRKSKRLRNFLNYYVNDLVDSRISSNTKGLVGYCLSRSLIDSSQVKTLLNFLKTEGIKAFKSGNITVAIDYIFGVENLNPELQKSFEREVRTKAEDLSIERLAKAILFLSKNGHEVEQFINILEQKIQSELSSWKVPEIELSLFEAYKLVNSNIPQKHLDVILTHLKKVKTRWATLIDKIKKEGVFLNLQQFKKIPSFSPNNDVWALLALKGSNREYSYQVSQEEHKEYLQLRRDKSTGYFKTHKSSVWNLMIFSVFLTLVDLRLFTIYKGSLTDVLTLKVFSVETGQDLLLILLNPWIETIIFIAWFYILYKKLLSKGLLRLGDYLSSWPICFVISDITIRMKEKASKKEASKP